MNFSSRDEAKEIAKTKLAEYLQEKGINTKKLFRCLHPNHEDKTPSMGYDPNREIVKCFGKCNTSYDIFDLVGLDYGLTTDKDKFEKTYEILNLSINEKPFNSSLTAKTNKVQNALSHKIKQDIANNIETTGTNYTQFYQEANSNIDQKLCADYLTKRGISTETAKRYNLGYVSDWISPKVLSSAQKDGKKLPPATPRLIIPTSSSKYVAIDVRPDGTSYNQEKYKKMKAGGVNIFNAKVLQEDKPCFVVEGEIDALSFLEIGYNAVALGGTSNIDIFINSLEEHNNVKCPLILALDNDDAGRDATKKLESKLAKLNCQYITAENFYHICKDANEYLLKDKRAFINSSQSILKQLPELIKYKQSLIENNMESEREEYKKKSVHYKLAQFKKDVASTKDRINISTGFADFDDALGGGLIEGLYVIGAITSLGKTTLAMQIADNLAEQGLDVLYFSLEMSEAALISKSLSRHTYLECLKNNIDPSHAKTARGISDGIRYKHYNSTDLDVIEKAYESYAAYTDYLQIIEGFGAISVQNISDAIKKHIEVTGNTPIIFIDYLQILASEDSKASDKQKLDTAVLSLKRICRDYKTPVICISSVNRASYNDKISLESFKESGGIEFSADVLLGLQYTGIGISGFEIDKAKSRNPRDIDLVIIKQRLGVIGTHIKLQYNPLFNYFKSEFKTDAPNISKKHCVPHINQGTSKKNHIIYELKDRESLLDFLENLDKDYVYGLDIETTGLNADSSKIALIQIYDPKDNRVYIYRLNTTPLKKAEELLLAEIHFVAHNAAFEKSFMPYLTNLECSMLLYHSVSSNRNCGLADLESVTGISYSNKKEMQTSNWNADTLSTEQYEYAAKDAKATYILWDKYKGSNPKVYNRMKRANSIIENYAKRGLPVDLKELQIIKQAKEKEREADLQKIRDLGYENIITPKSFTNKKDLIKALPNEVKSLVDKVRSCHSYINNIISGVEKRIINSRLPINVLICGTETGRLSTVSPNVQNFPRQGFRHIFKASAGYSIIKADFAGQELRMAAAISGEKVMLNAFNNGDDLHALMAAKLNNISIEEFNSKEAVWKKSERQKAKAANFGFLYGMGAKKFVSTAKANYGVELTEQEAIKVRNTFWESYPDLEHWCAVERQKCQERGYALTLGGRKRYFPDMNNAYCEQINTAVQGSAADILLETLIAIPPEIEKYLINTVHDELIFEVPKNVIDEKFKQSVVDSMIKGVQAISSEYPIRDVAEIQEVDTL